MMDTYHERLLPRLADSMNTAQPARVRDYLGRGKDNYEPDRVLAHAIRDLYPSADTAVQASRAFHRSATEHLATEGVRQFLDIGAGIGPSVHIVAHDVRRDARIVYVDHDPIVLCHGRAVSTGDNVHWYGTDLDEPQAIADYAGQFLDFTEPVAVSLVGVLEFVPAQAYALRAVRALLAPLTSGSALVLCTATADYAPEVIADVAQEYTRGGIVYRPRTRDQFAAFFERLVVCGPGIMVPALGAATEADMSTYAAVGRKP